MVENNRGPGVSGIPTEGPEGGVSSGLGKVENSYLLFAAT